MVDMREGTQQYRHVGKAFVLDGLRVAADSIDGYRAEAGPAGHARQGKILVMMRDVM